MRQAYEIQRASPFGTKQMNTMTIVLDMEDYKKWEAGELVQNALPYLTADEREFLMTGILPIEWNMIFKDPECIDVPETEVKPE
jgi:hypothetical protein